MYKFFNFCSQDKNSIYVPCILPIGDIFILYLSPLILYVFPDTIEFSIFLAFLLIDNNGILLFPVIVFTYSSSTSSMLKVNFPLLQFNKAFILFESNKGLK